MEPPYNTPWFVYQWPYLNATSCELSPCCVSCFVTWLYCWFLIESKCFITVKFASKNRSTQFCAQASSFLSSFPLRTVPVTHFFQQMSVREWTAVCRWISKSFWEYAHYLRLFHHQWWRRKPEVRSELGQKWNWCLPGAWGNWHCCILAFWLSLTMNRWSSSLSLSESLLRSMFCSSEEVDESIIGVCLFDWGGEVDVRCSWCCPELNLFWMFDVATRDDEVHCGFHFRCIKVHLDKSIGWHICSRVRNR